MTKNNFEDHMQYVADHMYYAIDHIKAIMEDNEKRKAYEEASGESLEDFIVDLKDLENHFNYYAFNSNIEENDEDEDDNFEIDNEFQDDEFEED